MVKTIRKISAGVCLAAMTAGILGSAAFLPVQAAEWESRLTTLAGVPGSGHTDGSGEKARFSSPSGLCVEDGTIWIADTENNLIRTYRENSVSTLAGQFAGTNAYGKALGGHYNGSYTRAMFDGPADCLRLSDGRVVVSDRNNHTIRMLGSVSVYDLNGTGEEGYAEGVPGQARFSFPSGLAEGPDGSIYVADTGNHVIRKITEKGVTSLVAGVPGQGGLKDGASDEALFLEPTGIAVGEDGSIYVADTGNQRIRRIHDGQVTTVAGGDFGAYFGTEFRAPGFADGQGDQARFRFPQGICMAGNVILVADTGNHVIRAVALDGTVKTIAGTGDAGYQDGAASAALLNRPCDLEWSDGILYIVDTGNSALRSMEFSPEEWLNSLGGTE